MGDGAVVGVGRAPSRLFKRVDQEEAELATGARDMSCAPFSRQRYNIKYTPNNIIIGGPQRKKYKKLRRSVFADMGSSETGGVENRGRHLFYPFSDGCGDFLVGYAELPECSPLLAGDPTLAFPPRDGRR
jgi:hypothetical protein